MNRTISNSDDVVDSRDVIARIDELQTEKDSFLPADEWEESEEGVELKALLSLAEQAEGCADWTYGESLIRDSYFEEYAQELAEDIGAINKDSTWPNDCIDWEKAAGELQYDYTSVEWDNVTYWIRS